MVGKYLRIWLKMTVLTAKIALSSRFALFIFLIGKLLRIGFFGIFLFVIFSRTEGFEDYNTWQMFFFFLSFNLMDVSTQFLLREVYRFRSLVLRGNFDYILLKPMSALFRSLFGGADIGDFFVLILIIGATFFAATKAVSDFSLIGVLSYASLMINGFIIALSFHILALSIGVLTMEVENTLWVYRDLTQMGRIPVDVYPQPMRAFITFVIPIGIIMTFPAKSFLRLVSPETIIISFLIGFLFLFLSIRVWKFSIKKYSSASS